MSHNILRDFKSMLSQKNAPATHGKIAAEASSEQGEESLQALLTYCFIRSPLRGLKQRF